MHLCVTNTIEISGVQFPCLQKMGQTALPPALRRSSPGEAPKYSSSCDISRKAEEWQFIWKDLQIEVVALHSYCLALTAMKFAYTCNF